MTFVRKTIEVEVKIGDEIKAPLSIFRDNIKLYVNYIEDDLLYISTELNSLKEDCETVFAEDCYLI